MTTKYSDEFKEEALALAQETSVSNASARLGVSTKAIYSYRQQKRLSEAPETINGDLEAQNRQLRRELEEIRQANTGFVNKTVLSAKQVKMLQKRNAELEEENLILKKAIAIFTPHSTKE